MEQFDFDKLIQEKVREENSSHQHEIEAAKPFIWAEVQRKVHGGSSLKWFHLAAAVIVVIVFFTFFITNLQSGHQRELSELSDKIQVLENSYSTQLSMLDDRENEVLDLKTEIQSLESKIGELSEKDPQIVTPVRTVVYRTDTVYVREIEYITKTVSNPITTDEPDQEILVATENQVVTEELDTEIFPTNTTNASRGSNEQVKFRFGSFVAKNK